MPPVRQWYASSQKSHSNWQHAGIHPNNYAKAGLYWLANFLREQGLGLSAGQHVITGSYAGFLDVPANRDIELAYADLGVLKLRFTTG